MPVIRKCLICQKEFRIKPYKIKKGFGKYCSKECNGIAFRGKNNPKWKGDKAGYTSIHDWIRNHYGTPKKCENCKTTDINKIYQWANISGKCKRDIQDFKRLCYHCHRVFDDPMPKGEKHPNAKLTNEQVIKIRELFSPRKFTVPNLMKKFNVSRSTIQKIISREYWKHI